MIVFVDCLRITEDKSSESRVYTPDARLIIATRAVPRRKGQSPNLSITVMAKTRSLKPVPQHHYSTKTQSLKAAPQHHCSTKTQGSKPASQLHCNAKTQSSKPASGRVRSQHPTAL